MGTQYFHADSFSLEAGKGKAGGNTVDKITGEADRVEGNCPHVENPIKPKILYGCSFSKAGEMAREWAESAVDGRGHKYRKDGLCFVAGVISAPKDLEDWNAFKADAITWLKQKYGKTLKSVIEHTDEPFRHIHFGVVANRGERFETIHDGYRAKLKADPNRGKRDRSSVEKTEGRRIGNIAYITAMRGVQDSFAENVGVYHALARTGPCRRRLTHIQQKREEQERKVIAVAKAKLREDEKKLRESEVKLEKKRDFNERGSKIIESKDPNIVPKVKLQKYFGGIDPKVVDAFLDAQLPELNKLRGNTAENQEIDNIRKPPVKTVDSARK